MKLKQLFSSLTIIDYIIWTAAILFITVSFLIFDRNNFMTLAASVIGVTSIIINAKGHPLGQLLMLFFAAVYGYISFSFHYYGGNDDLSWNDRPHGSILAYRMAPKPI